MRFASVSPSSHWSTRRVLSRLGGAESMSGGRVGSGSLALCSS
ncbi:hypothetical protein BN135_802 [Cronobacter muytjensii 530]